MNPKPLLLLPAALLCGAGLWFLLGGDDAPLPPDGPAPADGAATPGGGHEAAAATGGDGATEAAATADTGEARNAVSTREALVPIPDDARWIEVQIVTKATGAPLPGAIVRWHDATITEKLRQERLVDIDDYAAWRDPEVLAARFGWQTTSDARGIARIHQTAQTEVTARHGDLYGHARLGEQLLPPRGGFRLELEPDAGLDVQVLDASGRPALGVPVAVASTDADGEAQRILNWGPMAKTSPPDGVARLGHVQQWRRDAPDQDTGGFRVRTLVPGFDDPGVDVDLAALPADPVVLRLPATGRARVRAEINGQPVAVLQVSIYGRRRSPGFFMGRAGLSARPDADGWTRFEHLPLGQEYSATTDWNGSWMNQDFVGPKTDGAEVTVVIAPRDDNILLAGRLLDTDRAPVRGEKFQLRVRGDVQNLSWLETDEDGRFLAIVGRQRDESEARSIIARFQREGDRPLTASAAPRVLRAGTEDLGDLVLRLDELVLAGRCTVDGEPAKLPAVAAVQHRQERPGRDPFWRGVGDLRSWHGPDGAFEFRGTADAQQLRLAVESHEHLRFEPIEFRPGAQAVEVALRTGAELAATALTPEGASTELQARLRPVDGEGVAGDAAAGRLVGRVFTRPDGRQQAQWSAVAPGSYDLELSLEHFADPIWRVEGVRVPLPAGGDPRLVDIDLREQLVLQEVRLFDGHGEPLARSQGGFFPVGQDPDRDLEGLMVTGAETKLLLPRANTRLLVGITGYRPQEIVCRGAPIDVRLDPWPTVTVVVDLEAPLADRQVLQASLEIPDKGRRRWRARWRSGSVAELLGAPDDRKTVENGRAVLPIDDGARVLQLHLYEARRGAPVEIPRTEVRMTTPTVHVTVSAAALQTATEQIARQRR